MKRYLMHFVPNLFKSAFKILRDYVELGVWKTKMLLMGDMEYIQFLFHVATKLASTKASMALACVNDHIASYNLISSQKSIDLK